MSEPPRRMWFDPAPPGYPWPVLLVPLNITSEREAEILVDQVKEAGNHSVRQGDHYDALWKYSHAIVLCRDHKLPLPTFSIISSNCAQACLHLKYYLQAFSHADDAIRADPHSSILDKAFYRRAEATKLLYMDMVKKGSPLPHFPHNNAMEDAIRDYCHCFRLNTANSKALCEAIILAIDNSLPMHMAFLDCHIVSGTTTRVLHELLSRSDSKHAHLNFLLHDMPFQSTLHNHFDCSSIKFTEVCKKSLGRKLLTRMFSFGMTVSPEDVAHAVKLLPDKNAATLDVIAARCNGPPCESLSLAYVAAEELEKPQLLECLVKRGAVTPQEKVAKIKEEGNGLYHKQQYNDALAKYYQALPLCHQHKLEKEETLIRGNCAQVCLLLELFKDAFEHANECLCLDPDFSKGYYRRAEALRKMLESKDWKGRAPKGTSFSNVVSDYFQCHRKTENTNAIYQAIVVATNHNFTKSLSKLTEEELTSGLGTKLLLEMVQRDDSQQKHFITLLTFLVPETREGGIDASSLQVTDMLTRKSITSTKLIQRLCTLGMKVTETDVSSAVQTLRESRTDLLRLLLKECIATRKSTFTSACQEAIKAKKVKFIVCLIDNGGRPDVKDLKDVTGWPLKKVDPAIERYLKQNTQKKSVERPSNIESLVKKIREAHKDGKELHEAGHLLRAQKRFDDALELCQEFDLADEACEIYYSFAKLHVQMGRFETAFTECSVSLQIRPSAKMYYLRADVLRKALVAPYLTVPPFLNYEKIVSDYCQSHQLKESIEALTEAILVAVDHRVPSILRGEPMMTSEHVKSGFSTKLLLNLLKKKGTKDSHIKCLVTEMPIKSPKPHFEGSKVSISVLFKKKITDRRILETLFKCGMKVEENDLELAIQTLAAENTYMLDVVCTHFKGSLKALNAVCPIAMKLRKIRFVLYLLKKGCELPCASQEVLTLALQKNSADVAESLLPFCTLSEVDLGQLMNTCPHFVDHHQLIVKMIDNGANPNGLGKWKPLAEAQRLTSPTKRMDLICNLLEKGADCSHLCHGHTTPVHVATRIGLEAGGTTRVLDALVASSSFTVQADGKLIDSKGDTPLHLAMNSSWKREHSFKLLKALIETHKIPIDLSIRDRHGKKATDYLGKNDKRAPILEMATSRLQHIATGTKSKGGAKVQEVIEVSVGSTTDQSDVKTRSEVVKHEGDKTITPIKRENSYETMSVTAKLELHLKMVFGKEEDYFVLVTGQSSEGETLGKGHVTESKDETSNTQEINRLDVVSGTGAKKSLTPQPEDEECEITTVMSKYGLDDFDGLPWEVEVTNNVLKFFKSEKEHPYTLRLQAARTVYELAEGKRGKKLSKELSSQSSNLFEAKISKGGRIIWQRAVQFSPRRTGEHGNPIYAQVIRVWEIVPAHDQLNQTIKYCVKQIDLSNERGLHASLDVSLIPQKEVHKKKSSVRQQELLEIPKIFTQADVSTSDTDIQRYTPAASPKEDEYNVTTFYSFSGAVLKSMLTGSSARRDFPFKEWPKEHEIINLPDTESILLLGRSGTGKTTCCLYRLWNEFRIYWDRASVIMLPRKPLVTLKLSALEDKDLDSDIGPTSEANEEDIELPSTPLEIVADALKHQNKHMEEAEDENDTVRSDEQSEIDSEHEDLEDSRSCSSETGVNELRDIEEHLHQVFVTKNYVLCAQMKKRFYDMAAAHDFLEEHMEWEAIDVPHSFTDIKDYSYPLFLTARQFYILLDNSIGDGDCFFRPREKDGSLKVKILSSDYDHEDPDTLLDLEDSDSEGEEMPNVTDYAVPSTFKQQAQKFVEVTSQYFTEHIWPDISQKCGTRHLDPLLVWMEIQSFIKGSRATLLLDSALPLEDYLKIGYKMAPNFANERETIYNLFKRYEEHCQNKRHSVFLFDECDLVHDIHRRLKAVKDLPWSVHSLYIDEVQDFTQAELALYLHCCRHPNSLFFTGDTAQSIMRGIAFRFQDLRSLFHAIHEKVPQVGVPQEPHTLTINFRSHSGILQLAGSIIDLLQMFFKGSIDHLPADKGMFSGPTPVILESCEESDLALLLSSNKRESSRIEFGAHQVVLVQSKEAKENLPSILKGAIVLTIFESKGLEFDDVLLYNFFHDSMVDEKGWRVVTAYLEEHEETIMVNKRLPGSNTDPRSFKFDERCHKALNSELKYLYTAVTRAKCNLWIYDSNQKKRLPMFDLWYKRDLVKVVGDNLVGCGDQHSLIFASISTPQQWKIQGDYFMRRSRWEQAKHCYDRAGPENLFLSVEANARFLVQQATRLAKPHLYLEAAVDFLHRDQLTHSVQCLVFTAQCLRRAKPQKFASAAVLFERLGKYGDALRCYRKAKDIPNCVRLLEREHRYDEAVRMIRAPKEAIAKASEYASKGVELSPDLMPDNLSYMYARHYAKRKDKTTLLEMLKYMPDAQRKARFMKEGGLYDEALEMYVSQGELDDAYRLASGQRLFPKGREIARNHQDLKKEAKFLFHQIHAEFFIKNENKGKKVPLPPQFQADLHALLKAGDPSIKAHTSLLLGIATDDAGLCRTAHGAFLRHHNKVAALEAFSALTNLGKHPKPTTRQVLNACTVAQEVQNALERASDLNQLVKQATSFYGVQKVRNVYLMPPDHNMWLSSKLQSECVVTNDDEKDLDGMIRLRNEATRDVMASFVGSFIKKWLDTYRVQNDIEQKMKSFKLHNDVEKKRFLLRVYTLHEIPWPGIKGYMENIINYCDLGLLVNDPKICDTATSVLLSIFSPQVAVYLPLSKQHVTTVRKAVSIRKSFHERIKRDLDHDEMNRMDVWFSAWRACTLSDGNAELVANVLNDLEEKVNDNFKNGSRSVDTTATSPTSPTKHMFSGMWKGSRFQAPPAFQYWKRDDYYYHTFSCWLYACSLIRNESKPSWAAKQAIYHLLGVVSQRKSLSISVMNFVDVLVVHCMSVFAMLTILNHHQNTRSAKFIVPFLYKNCVRLFDDLNCSQEGDTQVYVACANEVRKLIKWNRAGKLRNDCYKLLDAALNILLGTYRIDHDLPPEEQKRFKVLTFAFRNDKVLSSGAAHHCLVLAITLFANCIPYQSQRKFEETRKMFNFFFSKVSEQGNIPGFLQEGRVIFQRSTTKDLGTKLFQYMGHLLSGVCPRGTPTKDFMRVDEKGKISFSPLPVAPTPGIGHSQSRTASQWPLGQVMHQPLGPIAQSPESTNSLLTTPTTWENAPSVSDRLQRSQSHTASQQPLGQVTPQPVGPIARLPEAANLPPTTWENAPSVSDHLQRSQSHTTSQQPLGQVMQQPLGPIPQSPESTGRLWENTPSVADRLQHSQSHTASQQPHSQVMQQPLGPIAQSPESTKQLWENAPSVSDRLLHSQSHTASQQPLGQVMQQPLGPIPQSPEAANLLLPTPTTWENVPSVSDHLQTQSFDQAMTAIQYSLGPYIPPSGIPYTSPLPPHLAWESHQSHLFEPHGESSQPVAVGTVPENYGHPPPQFFDHRMDEMQQPPGYPTLPLEPPALSSMPSNFTWDNPPHITSDTDYPQPTQLGSLSQMSEHHLHQQTPVTVMQQPQSLVAPPSDTSSVSLLPPHTTASEEDTPSQIKPAEDQPPTEVANNPRPTEVATIPGDYYQANLSLTAIDSRSDGLDEYIPDVGSAQIEETLGEPEKELEETLEGEDGWEDEDELGGEDDEEEEEDGPGMSTIHKSKWPLLPSLNPALTDPSIVTEQYCNICGVPFRVEHTIEDTEEPEQSETQPKSDNLGEIYQAHVCSDGHARNYTQHSKFKEMFDGCYTTMVEDMTSLIHKCEFTQAPSLVRLIDDMNEALEKYDRKISNRQTNLSWRMGINDIEKATEEFQRLLIAANREYQKIISEHPWKASQEPPEEQDGDSDTEFHAEINQGVEEMGDDHIPGLRSEETKMKSRDRKKSRKRKK